MKHLQPVIWMKGTFLSPQHLQTQDRFLENTLQFGLENLTFRPYGFRHITVDQAALAAGYFAIAKASGIFPDGLLFDIPDADGAPSPKPLAECFDPDEDELDVYLAIPHHRERGLNVAMRDRAADTRYVAEYMMLRDENTGLTEKPVQVARKNFRILTSGEVQQNVSAMRAGHVKKLASGQFQLDSRFVPPLLDLAASDYLISIVRRLVEILSAKSSILAGTRRQKNMTVAEYGTTDTAFFWLLYTVNAHFPVLQHIFESRRGHPDKLWDAMLDLAGALTTFSDVVQPRDLPKYDHDDLSTCFTDLDEKIRLLLDTVVKSNFVILPLKLVKPFIYATSLAEDRYLNKTKLYLAISAEMNEGDLISYSHLIKLCSANDIEHIVNMALPGVPLVHTPRPPAAIPVKLNYQYFALSQSGPAWESVRRSRNVGVYVPGEFPGPQLELVVLLPDNP